MANDRHKTMARRAVRQELHMGRMVRPSACSKCGSCPPPAKDGRSQIQGHHHKGYDYPLDVEWLCVQCHRDETPVNPLRGESAVTCKLTESDVVEIRTKRLSTRKYAAGFGVSRGAIYQIQKGLTWKHLLPAAPTGGRS